MSSLIIGLFQYSKDEGFRRFIVDLVFGSMKNQKSWKPDYISSMFMSIFSEEIACFKAIIPKLKKLYEVAIDDFLNGQVLSVEDIVRLLCARIC